MDSARNPPHDLVFGRPPEASASAPGRINLIGEHTDYNLGLVLPMAIPRRTHVALRRRGDGRFRVASTDFEGVEEFDRASLPRTGWAAHLAGVLHELTVLGWELPGLDVAVHGDVPVGRGLSSSASLQLAMVGACEALLGKRLDDVDAAKVGQRVENDWLGVACGLMDQMICRGASADGAMLIDCRSMESSVVPIADGVVIVVADTGVRRELTGSAYNRRVAECSEAVALLRRAIPGREAATSLRHFTADDVEALPEGTPRRRARHVVTENSRVRRAVTALGAGDWTSFGRLLDTSHESLAHDYEVSCPDLDAMCRLGRDLPGCLGSRMTGAGFGGCTIHAVVREAASEFTERLAAGYRRETGLDSATLLATPSPGVMRWPER